MEFLKTIKVFALICKLERSKRTGNIMLYPKDTDSIATLKAILIKVDKFNSIHDCNDLDHKPILILKNIVFSAAEKIRTALKQHGIIDIREIKDPNNTNKVFNRVTAVIESKETQRKLFNAHGPLQNISRSKYSPSSSMYKLLGFRPPNNQLHQRHRMPQMLRCTLQIGLPSWHPITKEMDNQFAKHNRDIVDFHAYNNARIANLIFQSVRSHDSNNDTELFNRIKYNFENGNLAPSDSNLFVEDNAIKLNMPTSKGSNNISNNNNPSVSVDEMSTEVSNNCTPPPDVNQC